jgi:hypothetical protein
MESFFLKKNRIGGLGLAFCLLVLTVSCESISKTTPTKSPDGLLPPPSESNINSVGIEIFTISIPQHRQELVRQLWLEVDEQSLSPQLRHELIAQGFRVGVLGNMISPSLSKLINVTANPQTKPLGNSGDFQEVSLAEMLREPTATRQYRNLQPEMRALLKAFDEPISELSLFWSEEGRFAGQTFKDAAGLICVRAVTQNDGSVQFEMMPELEYGVPEQRFRQQAGIVIHEVVKPRRKFESLVVSQKLLPGQWIIIGAVSSDCSGAGRAFFIREKSEVEQRFLAIRLVKVNKDRSLPLPLTPFIPSTMPERN